MTKDVIQALKEVESNPNYKKNGFYVDIRDNGTIVLSATKLEGDYTRHVSKEDSDQVLNLINIIIKES